jgi:ATP-dependent Clp protease, protease subunit
MDEKSVMPPIQEQLIAQVRPPVFISFSAEIVPQTTEILLGSIALHVNQGFQEIHLLLSTPGGSVSHGITIYNILRGLPVKIVTHNVGNVDSIGTVVFLAGQERYACPETTFMLHGVSCSSAAPVQFFERNLKERLAAVQADQQRISAIYESRAGIDPKVAEEFFLGETTMSAADARLNGIVHELRDVSIPAGSPVQQLIFNRQ